MYKIIPIVILVTANDMMIEMVKESDDDSVAVDMFYSGYYLARGIKYVFDGMHMYNQLLLSKREYNKTKWKLAAVK